MERVFDFDILPEIMERWSARAIDSSPIPKEEVMALLEAARYAPSCFNEQPWRFIVADEQATLEKMQSVLTSSNQVWASKAPVLILIAAKKYFARNGKENYWHMFDAGTAWGYLSLEAQKRNLIAHAMGGFSQEQVRSLFKIPDDIDVMTIVAIGRLGRMEDLPQDLQERERPDIRKEIVDLLL